MHLTKHFQINKQSKSVLNHQITWHQRLRKLNVCLSILTIFKLEIKLFKEHFVGCSVFIRYKYSSCGRFEIDLRKTD